LNCISLCPRSGVEFSRHLNGPASADAVIDASRRTFLIKGAVAALGVWAAGRFLNDAIRALASVTENVDAPVLPPGVADAEHFNRTCTSCQLCAVNCPGGVIKSSAHGFGPVRLDYAHAGCQYDCALCSAVCPSGALRYIALEDKQWLRIGEAIFEAPLCRVVKENAPCDLCAKACPKGAIFTMDGPLGLQIPEVNVFHCIGCGNCEAVCPVRPKAIHVRGIKQRLMSFGG
jgi:ferredoxin